MEEDIKILEEHLSFIKNFDNGSKYIPALENLIKGYRELEKQLDSSRKANELLNKTNNELRLEIRTTYSKVVNDIISKFNLVDDYIPKSKIKEKIEELEFKTFGLGNQPELWEIKEQIKLLQELMEDK